VDYIARMGDSAGKIAQLFTGSPVNSADLVRANPQKGATTVGGLLSFSSLLPGERLTLPDSWLRGSKGGPTASGVGAPRQAEYPGAFGPKYGGSGGVFENAWENQDHSLYPATGGASVYGQYYVISEGQLTLGALIMTAHPDQVIPPGFQSAAFTNANPRLQGVDPNVSLPAGTRVNVPERWVDSLQQAGYSVGNNMGVGQAPPAVPVTNGAGAPSPILPDVVPPGGSTPILCPDGTIAPGNDPKRCGQKIAETPDAHLVPSSAAIIACPDGEPAPGGDATNCPPPGAAKAAWNQNKHGKWTYEDPAYPGWVFPLEKNTWIHRGARGEYADHAFVTSDGKLAINAVLAAAKAAPNDAFFVANPNLRSVDPNALLPAGTIVHVPASWGQNLSTSGLKVNTPPGHLGAPAAPATPALPLIHTSVPSAPIAHAAPPPPAAHVAPAPPVARPAAPTPRPAPPRVQPDVKTGYVRSPSGHSWYRDERYPGYAYYENQWVPESQLEDYAFASGGAVQADTAYQQSVPYQQPDGGYPQPSVEGWVRGPRGSWRYMDRRYPGYGYDWAERRWMRHDELFSRYGG